MANLTLSFDPDLLRRARIRALENGTSVNAVVSDFLQRYSAGGEARDALRQFGAIADGVPAGSGPAGRTWSRRDAYDDA